MPAIAIAFESVNIPLRPSGQNSDNCVMVGGGEAQFPDGQRVSQVAGVARADDDRGDAGLIEHPARGDGGERDGVGLGDAVENRQQGLKGIPPAAFIDDQAIFDQAAIGEAFGGIGLPKPAGGEE